MPRVVESTLYKFSELSDRAKEKARDWYRDGLEFDPEYEPFETAARLLGIDFECNRGRHGTGPNIMYSGFSSQGDGASFTGTYTPKHSSQAIRDEFGTNTELHKIADALTAFNCRYILLNGSRDWSGKITHSGREVHKYSMYGEVYDANGEQLDGALCDEFTGIMRDFAQWIYDGLESQYDWLMSDEATDESIEANEYEFDEDGENQ